jgi:hypothetical protein
MAGLLRLHECVPSLEIPSLRGFNDYDEDLKQENGTSQRHSRKHPERPLKVDRERGLWPGGKSVGLTADAHFWKIGRPPEW